MTYSISHVTSAIGKMKGDESPSPFTLNFPSLRRMKQYVLFGNQQDEIAALHAQ
jgi:hypothetical protein